MEKDFKEFFDKQIFETITKEMFQYGHSLDKAVISLSGGALVLSIAFINQIAPLPRCIGLLWTAWGLFILSIITTLILFFIGRALAGDFLEYMIAEANEKEQRRARVQKLKKYDDNLGVISLTTFVFGLCLLTLFCILNPPQRRLEVTKDAKKAEQVHSGLK